MPVCKKAPPKQTITADDVLRSQMVLPIRERLIFRLAVCEGMRPGEIVGLQVGDLRDGIFHISRRVYNGKIDTPRASVPGAWSQLRPPHWHSSGSGGSC